MRKKILITVGVIIVVAGAVAGSLYLWQRAQAPKDTPKQTETVLDHSKDYSACKLLDTAAIKTALGEAAKDLQDPQDMGIVQNKAVGEGVDDLVSDSQYCVYAFKTGGTLENGYNSGEALIIERIVYTNDGGPKSLIKQVAENDVTSPVEGIGDAAFYSANSVAKGPGATYSFRLQVFIDKTSIRYMIRQPAESASFTDETAKTALIQLAKQAKQPSN
jgi:hypothetical protein